MPFKCNECEEEFDDENELGFHLISIHKLCKKLKSGDFKCNYCPKNFNNYGDMGMHLMWGHKFGSLTGDDLKHHEAFLKDPVFQGIINEINKR